MRVFAKLNPRNCVEKRLKQSVQHQFRSTFVLNAKVLIKYRLNMQKMSLFQNDSDLVLKNIEKLYQRNEKSMNEDIVLLKEWMQTQHHLPEILSNKAIQNFLILCKFSVEKAKQKIDMYYTMRNHIPEFFAESHPDCTKMKKFMESAFLLTLPKTMDGMYRVFFGKIRNVEMFEKTEPAEAFKQFCNIFEVRLFEDDMFGDVVIYDCEGVTLAYITKLTPVFFAKFFTAYENICSAPLKGFYLINSPPFASTAIAILKKILKPKLFQRIHVSKDDSLLTQYFDKNILPKDYGGEGISLEENQKLWNEKFHQYRERFDQLDKLRVDESLRPEKLQNDDVLGFYGNFKKLDLD